MYKLFMAFRYLRAHKIIYFSIVGVALGIMTMVVVTSLMGGFSRDMRARIRGMQSEIMVVSADKNLWLTNYDAICDEIRKIPYVTGCAPRIEYEAWFGRSGTYKDVHIVGIDPPRERGVSEVEKYFRAGTKRSFDFEDEAGFERRHPGIVVGTELRGMERRVGLLTARYGDKPELFVKDFEVVGSFNSGMAEYDSTYVFMPLDEAQEFLRLAKDNEGNPLPRVNMLAISVMDYDRNRNAVREAIVTALHEYAPCMTPEEHGPGTYGYGFRCGKYRTVTWEQSKQVLLQAVDVEKGMQFILLFLIVLVAGFNIIAIYTLVVRSKTRDIGILRALGATESGVMSIFLTSGGLCGLFGSIVGILLGLLLSWNLNDIADFIRVVSHYVNRISLDSNRPPNLIPRGSAWTIVVLLAGAGASLIWTWVVLYKRRITHPWTRIGLTAIALAAAAYFSTVWLPDYEVRGRHDPALSTGGQWPFVGAVVGLWLGFCAAWRGLDRFRNRPGWIFFGAAATVFMSALLLAIVAMLAVAACIVAIRPESGWRGLELFPSNIYYLDRIPVFVDSKALAYIVAITLLVSLIFSIYPALRAAAANPIEAIRDE